MEGERKRILFSHEIFVPFFFIFYTNGVKVIDMKKRFFGCGSLVEQLICLALSAVMLYVLTKACIGIYNIYIYTKEAYVSSQSSYSDILE